MAAESALTPTDYIQHHLTFLTKVSEKGGFWAVNVDTVVTSVVLGILAFGFMWLVTRKATSGVPSKMTNAGARALFFRSCVTSSASKRSTSGGFLSAINV